MAYGKLPTDIGMPSGGSLTADQWLLLSTIYGPIVVSQVFYLCHDDIEPQTTQIPQLWSACLPNADSQQVLIDRVMLISHQEAEKTVQSAKKATDSQVLKAAKAKGKDVYVGK